MNHRIGPIFKPIWIGSMQVLLPSIQCFVILFTVRNILKERNKEACGQSYQHSAILSYNACVEMPKTCLENNSIVIYYVIKVFTTLATGCENL